MNKKNNRKGFTTVELVIVIAVIAILATALIPTFGGLINSANKTADEQAVRNIYRDYIAKAPETNANATYFIEVNDKYYPVVDGVLSLTSQETPTCGVGTVDKTLELTPNTTSHTDAGSDKVCDTCGAAYDPQG